MGNFVPYGTWPLYPCRKETQAGREYEMTIGIVVTANGMPPDVQKLLGSMPPSEAKFAKYLINPDKILGLGIYQLAAAKFAELYKKRAENGQNGNGHGNVDDCSVQFARFCCDMLLKTGID